jgi:hypothetical protein
MPALMAYRSVRLLLVGALGIAGLAGLVGLGGCGKEIGDSCTFSTDCDPNGNRICDNSSTGGYCTIQGCDYNTCPDEAVCVSFFTGNFLNKTCDATMPSQGCSLDELCALTGHCVPRSSEVRFCMRKCDSDGDCRDDYECRTIAKMIADGGQPVLSPGTPLDSATAPKFCAAKPE